MASSSPDKHKSIVEDVAVRSTDEEGVYESINNVGYNGGIDRRAGYGGWMIAFGINAAAASVKQPDYNVYSVTGYFLAPTFTTTTMRAHVTSIRDTRTFATRRLDMVQVIEGKTRKVMFMVVDFQKAEYDAVLTYSDQPLHQYSPPEKCITVEDQSRLAKERGVSEKGVKGLFARFGNKFNLFETLSTPEGMMGQTLTGTTPLHEGPTDARPMPLKTTCEYFRSWKPLDSHLENVLGIAYLADGGMPYIPPAFAKVPFTEIGAAASLEFALRIFSNKLDMNKYMMREERSITGGDGRTYVEARFWDDSSKLVASMTEQCILRPRKPSKM